MSRMRVEPQPVRTRTAGRAPSASGSTRPMTAHSRRSGQRAWRSARHRLARPARRQPSCPHLPPAARHSRASRKPPAHRDARHSILVDLHGNDAGLGKLVECGRQATARGVAKAACVGCCGKHIGNQVVERRGVAFDRARKRQASRWLMMAMPWSPNVPDTRMTSPGWQLAPLSATPAGTSPTPAVLI